MMRGYGPIEAGGFPVRALTPIAIALSLVLLPQALAGPDPEGDGILSAPFGSTADIVVDCESPAADITYAWAYADGEAIRAGLSIADLDDRAITCSHPGGWTGTQGTYALYGVGLFSDGESDELGLTSSYLEVYMEAFVLPNGFGTCVTIVTESWSSPCLGSADRYGSNLTWSIPLAGSFVQEDGAVRFYDLAGRHFESAGRASVSSAYPGLSIRDSADIEPVQT